MHPIPAKRLYWATIQEDKWKLTLAVSAKGLCYAQFQNVPFSELAAWTEHHFPDSELVQDEDVLRPYVHEIAEYLRGCRKTFSLPLDLRGTPFQLAIWQALREIPHGFSSTYTQIAQTVKKPQAVRAVGSAIGANPVLVVVPCHRVIGKNGSLTGYRGGLDTKKHLLRLEQTYAD